MSLSRRAFLSTAAAASLPLRPSLGSESDTAGWYMSGGADAGMTHHAAVIDDAGRTRLAHELPARGHAAAVSPDGRTAVLCARRAGRFVTVINMPTLSAVHEIAAQPDRHFYGHACFSADGAVLFTTENAFDSGDGRIGVYDAVNGYRRIGEWRSHGIGPHELVLHPDGRTLVVANGGILTHPDTGREPLNLATMAPNLALIDSQTGDLAHRIEMPQTLSLLSSRHLSVSRDGTVAVVMQYQGDESATPPLIALVNDRNGLEFLNAPDPVQTAMANYCGSVAFDRGGGCFGVSSPRGNLFTFWQTDGRFRTSVSITDGCGIAPGSAAGTFVLSSGTGGLWRFYLETGHLQPLAGPIAPIAHWDNHLTAL
ncbi:MAG: DUF1513 domain-containing protein [Pseudomonadota bacterium]